MPSSSISYLSTCAGMLLAAMMVTGCSEVPELDAAVPAWVEDADYPDLIPLQTDTFVMVPPAEEAEEIKTELAARRDRLQERADRLRGTVVDDTTQARMKAGVGQ